MNKEIEKYIWYYLAVYIIILAIYAFFDYIISCSGNSLNCKVDWSNIKDILQTTAYMLTPIVAIVGFVSWQEQKEYDKVDKVFEEIVKFESNQKYIFKHLKEVLHAYNEEESNVLVIGVNIISLNFYHDFMINFDQKIKVLSKYSNDEEFINTVKKYTEKANKIAEDIHYFFSLYSNALHPVQNKILPNTLVEIMNHKKNGLEFDEESIKEIPEVLKIKSIYWFSFIFRFEISEKGLEETIHSFEIEESKQLKRQLNIIKKIPYSI